MTTSNVSTAKLLTPGQKCTEHAVIFRGSVGLPSTDDPLIGEKVTNFEFSKIDQKEKLIPADRTNFEKGEDHNPWEGIFSVNNLLLFADFIINYMLTRFINSC